MANKDRAAVESSLNDILGSVIQNDRKRSGRTTEEPVSTGDAKNYDNMTSPQVIEQSDTMTIGHYDNKTEQQADTPLQIVEAPAKRKSGRTASVEPPLSTRRFEEAKTMAATSTMTVTLRIPSAFNEWLDEYVHRSWPTKVRKQELVTEALQLLFARRGRPGEEIIETELLPDKEK